MALITYHQTLITFIPFFFRYKLISPTGTNDKIKEVPSMCAMDKGDLANKKGM